MAYFRFANFSRRWLCKLAAIYLVALPFLTVFGLFPRWLTLYYILISIAAFLMYWRDKRAAVVGTFRIPEINLHCVALAGGWPAAIYGQYFFRHKTLKPRFQQLCWLALLLHMSLLVSWLVIV